MHSAITNAMSVDVEDYFQVSAFEKQIPRDKWNELSCRVDTNTNRILDIFSEYNIKATFFTLGWVAEKFPSLVQRIVREGHELASHGFSHLRVTQQSEKEFREDIVRAKKILEDLSGVAIRGYRAPSYSIGEKNIWALDVLCEEGHAYSSSIYPIKHDLYGMPHAPRFAHYYCNGKLLEIPISTLEIFGKKIPCGGGGFFRLYPYPVSKWAIQHVNTTDKQPTVFYFHPWEIDPQQPRQSNASMKSKFRHYLNLDRMESRILRLLQDFSWDRMDKVFLEAHGNSTILSTGTR